MIDAARVAKLFSMSGPEVRSRMTDFGYAMWERRRAAPPAGSPDTRLGASLRRDLRRRPDWRAALLAERNDSPPRFFASLDDLARTLSLLRSVYPNQVRQTIDRADRTMRHHFELLGRTYELGSAIDWNADPGTGRRWPSVFHADVPVTTGDSGFGDAKDVWELNRQQFLIDLAKAWLLTGEDRYAEESILLTRSWIDANPVGVGVNWSGPLEVAYRALSWIWATALLRGHLRQRPDVHAHWLLGILDHGRFLHRHLEHYSSPFNHLIGEASVLYLLGTLFPQFRDASAWRTRARAVLHARLAEQFYADGGSVEQAAVYHHATLGFYLLAALTGRRHGDEFAPEVWSAIERAIEHSMYLMQPDGCVPAIGDNDDARPIVFEWRNTWDFRHFQAAGAVLFGRSDFRACAGRFHEEALWLLGGTGLEAFDGMAAGSPPALSKVLADSGYIVLRSAWTTDADYVCFDAGPHAGGLRTDAVPSAAHGHADCLSVVVTLAGRPLLVDPGFYTYNGDRDWERFFRETAAHNTVRVDGADQSKHLGKMAWACVATPTVEGLSLEGSTGWATASHDGYARKADGVTHRRTVWLRDHYVIIGDELRGTGAHRAEIIFNVAPECAVSPEEDGFSLGDRFRLAWSATPCATTRLHHGGLRPDEGWSAPSLGRRVAGGRLVLDVAFTERARVLTVLVDSHYWQVDRRESSGNSFVLKQADGERTDSVLYEPELSSGHALAGQVTVCRRLGADVIALDRAGLRTAVPMTGR